MEKSPLHLLLIDDDTALTELLGEYLRNEGFKISCLDTGEAGLAHLSLSNSIDLVVLDIMMPGISGLDVLRQLRPENRVPVIMLTGRGDDIDRIVGLEMGADDYMAKPCNPRELVARIQAVLRRSATTPDNRNTAVALNHHGIELRPKALTVSSNDQPVNLTQAEFSTLQLLMEAPGETLSKATLTEGALHRPLQAYDRSIDVHVSRIRQKLAATGVKDVIISIRNAGYQLRADPA